jgi:hypothetical protein
MENRNGLLVDFRITEANGRAERLAALEMFDDALPGTKRITVGADKGYDTRAGSQGHGATRRSFSQGHGATPIRRMMGPPAGRV